MASEWTEFTDDKLAHIAQEGMTLLLCRVAFVGGGNHRDRRSCEEHESAIRIFWPSSSAVKWCASFSPAGQR
jgi:hypothetical protein